MRYIAGRMSFEIYFVNKGTRKTMKTQKKARTTCIEISESGIR
jgi:hypothetical protein